MKLLKTRIEDGIPSLLVSAIDMKDGSPVYDIRPYLGIGDAFPE